MKSLKIVHLYPSEMNIYGDTGNRVVLEKRLEWRGIRFTTVLVHIGDPVPHDADIIIGGGGQDASQSVVAGDLKDKKANLQKLADNGCVMLMVCGMYQLFGNSFTTIEGKKLDGLGIFNVDTRGEDGRLIGNIVVDQVEVGQIVGYENHSGRTYLGAGTSSFATVVTGKGNDDSSGQEGCRINIVFGIYMHGPVLSKNPKFADLLISLALIKHGINIDLEPLDDSLENQAHDVAKSRPR